MIRIPAGDLSRLYEHFKACFENDICMGGSTQSQCKNPTIESHTIARKWLKVIARQNHVYCPKMGVPGRADRDVLKFSLTGLRQATARKIFCAHHDASLFRAIEAVAFQPNAATAHLLHFRAICRELWAKLGSNTLRTLTKFDFEPSRQSFEMQADWDASSFGEAWGLRDIASHYWPLLDRLERADHSRIRFFATMFDGVLPYAVVGAMFPEFDFQGKALADLAKEDVARDAVGVSGFSDGGRGFLVFTWEAGSDHAPAFVSSFKRLHNELKAQAGFILALEHFENLAFSPIWWESLDEQLRTKFVFRQRTAGSAWVERKHDCLAIQEPIVVHVPVADMKSNDGAVLLSV